MGRSNGGRRRAWRQYSHLMHRLVKRADRQTYHENQLLFISYLSLLLFQPSVNGHVTSGLVQLAAYLRPNSTHEPNVKSKHQAQRHKPDISTLVKNHSAKKPMIEYIQATIHKHRTQNALLPLTACARLYF